MARGGRRTSRSQQANPESLLRKLRKSLRPKSTDQSVIGYLLRRRVPIHFGGMSDPFSTPEIAAVSYQLLRVLNKFDYPVVISTKNTDLLSAPATVELMRRMKHLAVQISFSSLPVDITSRLEPLAPSVEARVAALSYLAGYGIPTMARLQPFFPLPEASVVFDLIQTLAGAGCNHVTIEHLKLPVEKRLSLVEELFKALNWDGYAFYRQRGARLVGREWILPQDFMWGRLLPIVAQIRGSGMTYGSADYGLTHMGDTQCCCGVDNIPGFSNWFAGNLSCAVRGSPSSVVDLASLAGNWFPSGSIGMYMNSHCRSGNGNDMLSHLVQKWNSPGTVNAPDSFMGISCHGQHDEDGNCVYSRESAL